MARNPATRRHVALLATAAVAASVGVAAAVPAAARATAHGVPAAARGASAQAKHPLPIYRDTHYSFAERAADLVSRMTLAEKVGQLRTNSAPAIPRLGVQAYTYWSEGQHGINLLGANTNPGSATGGPHATSFPTNMASAMSWDPKLTYHETTAISDEIRGALDKSLWGNAQNNIGPNRNDYGDLTYWAPTVNMDRDPRWGRTDEAFGEDPYLVSTMAGAFVAGYQGEKLSGAKTSKYLKVAATAKHFALNNVEATRHTGSSDTSDANIRNYYTAQFRSLVEKAHVAGVMTSYNAINGTPAPADTYTANELLQRTWGFHGYTTSDCDAVGNIYRPSNHDWAPPGWTTTNQNGTAVWTNDKTGKSVPGAAGAQAYAVRAGTQLNCTGGEDTLSNYQSVLGAGAISMGVIDDALTRLFTMRMSTGEFDPRSAVRWTKITRAQIQSPAHQKLARKVADNSLVLLKNSNVAGKSAPLLPVAPKKIHNVVIVGDLANKVTLGGYSGSPTYQTNAVQGITRQLPANANVVFDACGTSTTTSQPANCSQQTLDAIKSADLVVVFAGTDGATAGEEHDRANLQMPGNYTSLINQVHAAGNPRTVLALQTDGPVDLTGIRRDFPAIVFSAYNGQAQGTALADVLFGKQNPDGHLDFTWYQNDSQLPDIQNYGLAPAETGGLGRTYEYFTGKPTFPFGYGKSYSSFSYSNIKLHGRRIDANGTAQVSFTVTNTGRKAGTTVAQLYTSFPKASGVTLPTKKLIGFRKSALLKPGQRQKITISVKAPSLALFDENAQREVVYPGRYRFRLARNANSPVATLPLKINGTLARHVKYVTVQPDRVVFRPGDELSLTATNKWIADDTAQAAQHVNADRIVEAVNNDESFADLSHARVSYRSSNAKVASVGRNGRVVAHAPGAATIRVTVNGVTGSTPVVVQEPFSLTAPALSKPGQSFVAKTTLPNPAGGPTLTNVVLQLTAPQGWTVTALNPASYPRVRPGQTVTTRWRVTPPANVDGGGASLDALAQFTGPGGRMSSETSASVQLPYPSFTAAFDNVGITADSNTDPGSLDGGGRSFSADALAAATPAVTPGATISHDGTTFTWPSAPAGTADNVVASGQTITVNKSGGQLVVAGTANNGTASGTGTITYSDGSTATFALSFSDWWSNAGTPDSDILTSVPYLNNANASKTNQKVSLYYAAVPLDSSKTVEYVTLPDVSEGPVSGLAMHIFDLAVTS